MFAPYTKVQYNLCYLDFIILNLSYPGQIISIGETSETESMQLKQKNTTIIKQALNKFHNIISLKMLYMCDICSVYIVCTFKFITVYFYLSSCYTFRKDYYVKCHNKDIRECS